jgi:phospholipid N-methyltransferase
VLAALEPGDLLVDYSSGTGILTRRLLDRIGHEAGILNVDASPKFLRVALKTFRDDERVAFRLLRSILGHSIPFFSRRIQLDPLSGKRWHLCARLTLAFHRDV